MQLDRAVLVALAGGLALYVMPCWAEGRLRAAFWLTLTATLAHIYTSHQRAADAAPGPVVVDAPKEAP
ncbi:MAG: hypothetical protein ABJA82_03835 [Myxococcales bacterium]